MERAIGDEDTIRKLAFLHNVRWSYPGAYKGKNVMMFLAGVFVDEEDARKVIKECCGDYWNLHHQDGFVFLYLVEDKRLGDRG